MLNRSMLAIAIGAGCILTAASTGYAPRLLINAKTLSPIFSIATPRAGASCASKELNLTIARGTPLRAQSCENGYCTPADPNSFTFRDRSRKVLSSELGLGAGDPAAGPIEPVDGPGTLKWLCRENEEKLQCECIPWPTPPPPPQD